MTDYHAKYFSYDLNSVGGQGLDRIGRALFDACVDLNPHQIEAALFALRSPISKGVLMADEVGLGKTIEAGLVLCQYWAERKRHLLVIAPASLRKQWELELADKFNLNSIVLDAKTFEDCRKTGNPNPFDNQRIVICSMHFAASKEELVRAVPWDIVVIDEAHKLRNAYRPSNRIGQAIRRSTENCKKILLTATPLQNSLMELYGLSTIIDGQLFGDPSSFRSQFVNQGGDLLELRERLRLFCRRTLRSDVVEYIQYTKRQLITRPFNPTQQEQHLYETVSKYLQRDDAYALPSGQKHLIVLLVRKVLASSPYAVSGTLEVMKNRLLDIKKKFAESKTLLDHLTPDSDFDDDLLAEILEDAEDHISENGSDSQNSVTVGTQTFDPEKLDQEIKEIDDYIRQARSIGVDTKSRSLLKALEIGFQKMKEMGAAQKIVVFTESKRTQAWLKDFLESNGYANHVLTFNGTNNDDASGEIYRNWLEANRETGRISGSKAIDLRAAIIDRFRTHASILIATEAGAEGLNLQFCSAIVNYDLPWNPQRIEQRIGRCHRYGQKYDVVVINFLNQQNEADRRIYQLLEEKFQLFSGVFGASDEVLGTIETGIDFEHRIFEIYQQCRSEAEIKEAFEQLQKELEEQIQGRLGETREKLLEHFDEDVHSKLNISLNGTRERLDRIGKMFWYVTQHILRDRASFEADEYAFDLENSPISEAATGHYQLVSKNQENRENELRCYVYRLNHPLGEYVLTTAQNKECPTAEIVFDSTGHETRIALVEQLRGKSGWLALQHLRIDSFSSDEHLLFSAVDDTGTNLDQETCEKLFRCDGRVEKMLEVPADLGKRLGDEMLRHADAVTAKNLEENNRHFIEARDKLDKWAVDMELAAGKELDDVKRRIQELQRQSRQATTLDEQNTLQSSIADLERKKKSLRQKIFDLDDEIAEKRDLLIEQLEKRMKQKTSTTQLFTIRWKVD